MKQLDTECPLVSEGGSGAKVPLESWDSWSFFCITSSIEISGTVLFTHMEDVENGEESHFWWERNTGERLLCSNIIQWGTKSLSFWAIKWPFLCPSNWNWGYRNPCLCCPNCSVSKALCVTIKSIAVLQTHFEISGGNWGGMTKRKSEEKGREKRGEEKREEKTGDERKGKR